MLNHHSTALSLAFVTMLSCDGSPLGSEFTSATPSGQRSGQEGNAGMVTDRGENKHPFNKISVITFR